jgi:ATP-dependent RNA helicase DDX5/DBP2
MSVKGENIPRPVSHFDEAGFPKYINETLSQQGFTKPTCIQS